MKWALKMAIELANEIQMLFIRKRLNNRTLQQKKVCLNVTTLQQQKGYICKQTGH